MNLDQLLNSSRLEQVDARIREWAIHHESDEHAYSVLIGRGILERAEYPAAFPHLLMAPAAAVNPAEPLRDGNSTLLEFYLSPAVCYHTYARLAGTVLQEGVTITARGHCFRNEAADRRAPGRR